MDESATSKISRMVGANAPSLEHAGRASKCECYYEPLVKDAEFEPSVSDYVPAIDPARHRSGVGVASYVEVWGRGIRRRLERFGRLPSPCIARSRGLHGRSSRPLLRVVATTFRADQALLVERGLSIRQLRQMETDVAKIQNVCSLESRFGFSERCLSLSKGIAYNAYQADPMDRLTREQGLKMLNGYFDRISAVWKLATYRERCEAAEKIEDEWRQVSAHLAESAIMRMSFSAYARRQWSRTTSNVKANAL